MAKVYVNLDNDYLAHAAKGSQKPNHLYTAREWINGKWRYYYNTARAGINSIGMKRAKSTGNFKKQANQTLYKEAAAQGRATATNAGNYLKSRARRTIKSTTKAARSAVDNAVGRLAGGARKTASTVRSLASNTRDYAGQKVSRISAASAQRRETRQNERAGRQAERNARRYNRAVARGNEEKAEKYANRINGGWVEEEKKKKKRNDRMSNIG